ncbi:hypothetical protein LJC58_09270 [Lachnospiraceae bacterium OttesenSCG-928-D06]|nr:hypothetical protein [Lachnospiraceae bacterium OttesenSCG-928-D06]
MDKLKRKITFVAIIMLLLIIGIMTNINKNQININISNPFFFEKNMEWVDYNGYFIPLSGDEIHQKVSVHIIHIKDFSEGVLYKLQLSKLDVTDPFDQLLDQQTELGYFWVTNGKIYRYPYRDGVDETIDDVVELIQKDMNLFWERCYIVCDEEGTDDAVMDGEWHQFIEKDDNKRIFRYYSDYTSGTRYYEEIVWEKEKGIVYYKSGRGEMLMHMELEIELE